MQTSVKFASRASRNMLGGFKRALLGLPTAHMDVVGTGRHIHATAMRSGLCGEVASLGVGSTVVLCGWLQNPRKMGSLFFARLRDHSGLVQIAMARPDEHDVHMRPVYTALESLQTESVVRVTGVVAARPAGLENREMETGGVEIAVQHVEVRFRRIPTNHFRAWHAAGYRRS